MDSTFTDSINHTIDHADPSKDFGIVCVAGGGGGGGGGVGASVL